MAERMVEEILAVHFSLEGHREQSSMGWNRFHLSPIAKQGAERALFRSPDQELMR